MQFHWHNSGYRDFDHYLESFTADKRKKAKRERRRVLEDGVTFETLLGPDLDRAQVLRVLKEVADVEGHPRSLQRTSLTDLRSRIVTATAGLRP